MERFARLGGASGLGLLFLLLVGFSAGSLNPLGTDFAWAQKAEEITIFHTNSVTGHVFGCPT